MCGEEKGLFLMQQGKERMGCNHPASSSDHPPHGKAISNTNLVQSKPEVILGSFDGNRALGEAGGDAFKSQRCPAPSSLLGGMTMPHPDGETKLCKGYSHPRADPWVLGIPDTQGHEGFPTSAGQARQHGARARREGIANTEAQGDRSNTAMGNSTGGFTFPQRKPFATRKKSKQTPTHRVYPFKSKPKHHRNAPDSISTESFIQSLDLSFSRCF